MGPASGGAAPPGSPGAVPPALERLGSALLSHAENEALLRAVEAGAAVVDFYRALLAITYRVLAVHAAAARRGHPAVHFDGPAEQASGRSVRWRGLLATVGPAGPLGALGLPVGREGAREPDLRARLGAAQVDDADVATFLAALTPSASASRSPDAPLDALGPLHEGMLAQTPVVAGGALRILPAGRGRRASGSYYTPAPLVDWLLDAALDPALDEAAPGLTGAAPAAAPNTPALLRLRVCDPACGAGAFLLPAARRIAARLEAGGAAAADALASVASTCMYGVDLDPLAVFACQATLWLATLGPHTPDDAARATALALAAHIRRGDALLGADAATVAAGVPDLAFVAHAGDDRTVATAWRARNRAERNRAERNRAERNRAEHNRAGRDHAGRALFDPAPAASAAPSAPDAWCAAFFWPRAADAPPPPTSGTLHALPAATAGRVAELAARHGFFHWDTAFPDAPDGFDVMLGNPPFLNQLEQDTVATRPAAALLRARFPEEMGAYTDTAALLLLDAARRLRPNGRLGMVQPQSILAAADTRAVRTALARLAPPTHVWWAGTHVFAGTSVYVTALALRRDAPAATFTRAPAAALTRAHGPGFTPLAPVPLDRDALAAAETWTPLVAEALGAPALATRTRGTLGELAHATGDFRDEYYGLVPYVVDRAEADEARFPRLVLTGHVDPARSWWGVRPVRFGKRAWAAPRVDLDALRRGGDLADWARARRVPKVLVATQTRVLEAVVDPDGAWLTTTPTLTVLPRDPAHLWRVAAVLLGPPASAWALTHFGASALAAGAIKLSAKQVEAIPLPADAEAWDEAATHVAAAHAAPDPTRARALLVAAAAAMVRACGGDAALLAWWQARLPDVDRP